MVHEIYLVSIRYMEAPLITEANLIKCDSFVLVPRGRVDNVLFDGEEDAGILRDYRVLTGCWNVKLDTWFEYQDTHYFYTTEQAKADALVAMGKMAFAVGVTRACHTIAQHLRLPAEHFKDVDLFGYTPLVPHEALPDYLTKHAQA